MGRLALWASIVVFLLPCAAFAQSISELNKCRKTKDHALRLDCYDTAMDRVAAPAPSGAEMSWKDLQLDYAKFRGKRVTTTGTFLMMGDQGLLYDMPIGMTAFFVDVRRLSREDRSTILENCQTGCPMKVTGKVADVAMQKGIIAADVELE